MDSKEKPADSYMVGGDHYLELAKGGEQHWDMMWRLYREAWFVGAITKYTLRYRKKNGVQDLEKARHYLDKLIELETAAAAKPIPDSMGKARARAGSIPTVDAAVRRAAEAGAKALIHLMTGSDGTTMCGGKVADLCHGDNRLNMVTCAECRRQAAYLTQDQKEYGE